MAFAGIRNSTPIGCHTHTDPAVRSHSQGFKGGVGGGCSPTTTSGGKRGGKEGGVGKWGWQGGKWVARGGGVGGVAHTDPAIRWHSQGVGFKRKH